VTSDDFLLEYYLTSSPTMSTSSRSDEGRCLLWWPCLLT